MRLKRSKIKKNNDSTVSYFVGEKNIYSLSDNINKKMSVISCAHSITLVSKNVKKSSTSTKTLTEKIFVILVSEFLRCFCVTCFDFLIFLL